MCPHFRRRLFSGHRRSFDNAGHVMNPIRVISILLVLTLSGCSGYGTVKITAPVLPAGAGPQGMAVPVAGASGQSAPEIASLLQATSDIAETLRNETNPAAL